MYIARNKGRKEYFLSKEEYQKLLRIPGVRGAHLTEQVGPVWKDIYWTPNQRPYVSTQLTRVETLRALGRLV
jgi:hypothetical protein